MRWVGKAESTAIQQEPEPVDRADPSTQTAPERRQWFVTTQWNLVLSAGQNASPAAEEALEKLCQVYWYPLYAYARRCGQSPHDAQDMTQGFFARLLEKNYLGQVVRERGRFRSFLLSAFKHFLSDEHDRATTIKRGGGKEIVSLDEQDAEGRYSHEPAVDLAPEKLFERQWALTLLEKALGVLRKEFEVKDRADVFDAIKIFLNGETESGSYQTVADRIGASTGAVTVMVHRLRQRYRELVRMEVAHTVQAASDVDEEMRRLLAAISS